MITRAHRRPVSDAAKPGSGRHHEAGLGFGYQFIGIGSDHAALHDDESPPLFYATTFQRHGDAGGQAVLVSNVTFCGIGSNTLEINPVRHHIIQNAEYDATVSNAVVAAVGGGRGKFRSTNIIFYSKYQFQAGAVAGTADEAVVPV